MNKFEYKNLTPFKWFVLENFPFIEADFDALTEWQLFCKLGKEMNKIINNENTLGTQVENVTNAFIELQNYINNYVDNLDVQEEINTKLDEMAKDGTLERIINQDLFSQMNFTFDTLVNALNYNYFVVGNKFSTYGYSSVNDGGSAIYQIISSENFDNNLIDNGKYIKINENLIAEQIVEENTINILTYGVNLPDYSEAVQNALKYSNTIFFPTSTYNIYSKIELEWGKSLIGGENYPTIITNKNTFVNLTGRNNLKNFKISSTVNNPITLSLVEETEPFITGVLSYSEIDNINIGNAFIGMDIKISGSSSISNIKGLPLKYGIKIDNSVDICYINNVNFNPNYYGTPSPIYLNYLFENAFALYIGRADWGFINNISIFGYCGLCTSYAGSIGGSANNFTFNNYGCDGCKNFFVFVNNSGGFKFINGTCTFFNPWFDKIEQAGLSPSHASRYPITANIVNSGNYETSFIEIENTVFYRLDFALALVQSNTNFIFKNNYIKNPHMLASKSDVNPVMHIGGNSIICENTIINSPESLVGEKQGIYVNNSNVIIANNRIIGYNQPIANASISSYITNNNTTK